MNTRRDSWLLCGVALALLGPALCDGAESAEVPTHPGSAKPPDGDVVPPSPERLIDLPTALSIAGADNPTIALAAEAVQARRAGLLQARALWLPNLDTGASYNLHRGNLQSSQGIILDVDRESAYTGAGAFAVGAGTITIPGIRLTAHLADAFFEPQAARLQVEAAGFQRLAVDNNVLLEVATRYLDLAGAQALLASLRQSEGDASEIVRLTANFARTGQGRTSDAGRARAEALLLRAQAERAEEDVAVAAAELARLLSLDPSCRLLAADEVLPLVELINPWEDLETLIQAALRNRPEVGAAGAAVATAETHLRQERYRPLLPRLSVGYSAGDFGGGSTQADRRFGHFNGRSDFDALAVWTLDGAGAGNLAAERRWRVAVGEAEAERLRVIDRIRREVAEALAACTARRAEVEVASRQVKVAEEGFRLDLLRSKNLEGRPIEVQNSLNLVAAARQGLIRAVVAYDQAQFRLFVALGQPPTATPGGGSCP